MKAKGVSEQLRNRRAELGLSLSVVARRAGTTAATLSRYEHGWTRFETYTLRKLALALGCELEIELRPKSGRRLKSTTRRDTTERLKRLFWDHSLCRRDLIDSPVWVVERVLDYGNLDDIDALRHIMGREAFVQAVAAAHRVSPKTRGFWLQILDLEGRPCTTKYSRNTAWIS